MVVVENATKPTGSVTSLYDCESTGSVPRYQVLSSNPMKPPIILFPSLRVEDCPIKSRYFYIFLLQVFLDSHGFTIDTAKRQIQAANFPATLYCTCSSSPA